MVPYRALFTGSGTLYILLSHTLFRTPPRHTTPHQHITNTKERASLEAGGLEKELHSSHNIDSETQAIKLLSSPLPHGLGIIWLEEGKVLKPTAITPHQTPTRPVLHKAMPSTILSSCEAMPFRKPHVLCVIVRDSDHPSVTALEQLGESTAERRPSARCSWPAVSPVLQYQPGVADEDAMQLCGVVGTLYIDA